MKLFEIEDEINELLKSFDGLRTDCMGTNLTEETKAVLTKYINGGNQHGVNFHRTYKFRLNISSMKHSSVLISVNTPKATGMEQIGNIIYDMEWNKNQAFNLCGQLKSVRLHILPEYREADIENIISILEEKVISDRQQ